MAKLLAPLIALLTALAPPALPAGAETPREEAVRRLAEEVRGKGWIACSSRPEGADWDIWIFRPDGSSRRNVTSTPEYHEGAPQFSRDGSRLLWRRIDRTESFDNNAHGTQGVLVVAAGDGSRPEVLGGPGEHPWASWSPDGRSIVTLSIRGISFVDLETGKVARTLPRKGFFQQLVWSPDGRWLCGVANSYGASWSIARMDAATGEAAAVNRVDCCTPDWFPDSDRIVFSWRPPGQKAHDGYGWTQLWMARADGTERKLLYGEDGRHVYGGHVSPDGEYVLFTGNPREDGDPERSGAPMGLLRLADTPTIGGPSEELRALHPGTVDGPVLELPDGWEPCWTYGEAPGGGRTAEALAAEVRGRGWIVFSARTTAGDWDLYLCRPDGSQRRALTATPDRNEAGARFSPDGRKLLYYRMDRTVPVDNNTYGLQELVVAEADGDRPETLGDGFPWATWGPGGDRIAVLRKDGVSIVDLATRKALSTLPRRGFVEQLAWSPDGAWLAGTANGLGPFWTVGRMAAGTGEVNAASEVDRYNCTPDWSPDGREIIYSRGIVPEKGGRAELWAASGDGASRRVIYAEEDRHVYGGCFSPDGAHVIFTRSVGDLGGSEEARVEMALIRSGDAPIEVGSPTWLAARGRRAGSGPRLDLGWGWEPHWTLSEAPAGGAAEGAGPVRRER